jgi:hypothetical protein
MSRTSENLTKWESDTGVSGITSASLLVIVLVATAFGALTGVVLEGAVGPVALAILAGLIGTVTSGIVRNTFLVSAWDAAGVEDVGTPGVVVAYAAVASLAGSLSSVQLMSATAAPDWPVLTGALAGLLSAGLMGLLIVTYRMPPRKQE